MASMKNVRGDKIDLFFPRLPTFYILGPQNKNDELISLLKQFEITYSQLICSIGCKNCSNTFEAPCPFSLFHLLFTGFTLRAQYSKTGLSV